MIDLANHIYQADPDFRAAYYACEAARGEMIAASAIGVAHRNMSDIPGLIESMKVEEGTLTRAREAELALHRAALTALERWVEMGTVKDKPPADGPQS